MRRAVTAASVLMAVAAAVALYAIGYDTRRLAARVHGLEKTAEHAEADIAAAKAELSHLSRPSRIEPLARALGDTGRWLMIWKLGGATATISGR